MMDLEKILEDAYYNYVKEHNLGIVVTFSEPYIKEYNLDTSAGHPVKDDDIVRYSEETQRVKDKEP